MTSSQALVVRRPLEGTNSTLTRIGEALRSTSPRRSSRTSCSSTPSSDASGFELCGRLRDGEPGRRWNRDVPVIMVSARGDLVERVRGFARGCDDYVVRTSVALSADDKAANGLPFEALFDARNALFGPILVAPSRPTNSPDDVETLSITGSAYATLDGLPASVI